MTNSAISKETLVAMLSEMYNQLEELENEIEIRFSELNHQWEKEEKKKITATELRIVQLEKKVFSAGGKAVKEEPAIYLDCSQSALKFELGY
ncbi:hypothetical protein ACF5W4_11410 [Bacillota bacterium Lsc_1132]